MTTATPTQVSAHTLDAPGVTLYYELRGSGPLLVLVGAPLEASVFAPLADSLADTFTVLTTDPRGISRSVLEDPEQDSTPVERADEANGAYMLGHMLAQGLRYEPDFAALRGTRIVIGVGAESAGQLCHRTATAAADRLGVPVTEFPGDHGGFLGEPDEFEARLRHVLG